MKILLLYAADQGNRTLSYQGGWPRAFLRDSRFEVVAVNVAGRKPVVFAQLTAARLRRVEGVVALHSVFSNEQLLAGAALDAVARLQVPKAYFIGNEYKLMPEKMAFAEHLGISLLVTQMTTGSAHELYAERLGCAVAGIPNTGLDTEVFAPRTPWDERPIDLGYRSYESPLYLGHNERRDLAERIPKAARGLVVDVSLDPEDRLDVRGWAAFLDRCKGQLGSEAGGDHFELDDRTRHAINAFLDEHPGAPLSEIRARFFVEPSPISARMMSGRVVEAAGTKTVQLLLEGEYGGFFQPGEHYIELRKDFSNVDDALEQFRDRALCERLREAAHEVALSELTWDKLVGRFHEAFAPLVG